jgi:hypothetical protein
MRNPSFRDAKHAFRFGCFRSIRRRSVTDPVGFLCPAGPAMWIRKRIWLRPSTRRSGATVAVLHLGICFVAIARPEGRASLDPYAPRHDGGKEREKLRKRAVELLKSFVGVNLCMLPRKPAPLVSPIASAVRPFPLLVAGAPSPSPRLEAPPRHRQWSRSRP